jgi:hypothetical protein
MLLTKNGKKKAGYVANKQQQNKNLHKISGPVVLSSVNEAGGVCNYASQ